MRIIKYTKFIVLLCLVISSCQPEDTYYNLTDEAKDFLVFQEGDNFKLLNETTQEVLNFTVNSRDFSHEEGGSGVSSTVALWGPSGDTYFEKGVIAFTGSQNCNGEITVIADRYDEYHVLIYLYGCFEEMTYTDPLNISSIDINGVNYENVYSFLSNSNLLYFSKEKGILKIENFSDQTIKFTLIE